MAKKEIKNISRALDPESFTKKQKSIEKIKRKAQEKARQKRAQKEGEIPSMEEKLFGKK